MAVEIRCGDCRDVLARMSDESVHCVVTSPPYWGLRDYKVPPTIWGDWCGAIGLEPTLQMYVEHMVEVFREVRRVLRKDGTLWLNLGDSYATGAGKVGEHPGGGEQGNRWRGEGSEHDYGLGPMTQPNRMPQPGLKPKDVCGIPWRVAFALQADGWWLRSDIIWAKPNPMPESVTDRPTKAHEYLFLLSKSERYFYDAEAIREPQSELTNERFRKDPRPSSRRKFGEPGSGVRSNKNFHGAMVTMIHPDGCRNKRSVWEITTSPFPEAHFATFPPALVEPCIKAGTSEKGCCAECLVPWKREIERVSEAKSKTGPKSQAKRAQDLRTAFSGYEDGSSAPVFRTIGWSPSCSCNAAASPCTVLDPFGGSGTVGLVADQLQRNAILIELNEDYARMASNRIKAAHPLFAEVRKVKDLEHELEAGD